MFMARTRRGDASLSLLESESPLHVHVHLEIAAMEEWEEEVNQKSGLMVLSV